MNRLKTALIGPGSIGLLMASRLFLAGHPVSLIDYRKERAHDLNDKGILFEDQDVKEIRVPVLTGYERINEFNLVIICVKSYDTGDVAAALEKSGYTGPVMTLQNGYGNAETIGSHYRAGDIIAGITSEGANMPSPGRVKHAGKGKTLFGLAYDRSGNGSVLGDISDLLSSAGFDTEISRDVEALIWSKLLINVGINALTAVLNIRNGMLLEIPPARKLMHDLVNEAWELVRFMEITLPYPDPLAKVDEVCSLTAENYSSMNRDIAAGRRTEIDYINGAIVRTGKKMGIITPYNEAVNDMVKGLEYISSEKKKQG